MSGRRAFDIAIIVSFLTALVAGSLGFVSGSMVVLAVAADKLADAAMSGLNRWAFGFARQAPDAEHPWGHGKVEGAISMGQALVLAGIVVSVVAGAIDHFTRHRVEVPDLWLAIPAMAGVGIVSLVLSLILRRAARKQGALTLEADAAHYRVDVLHTAAGLLGLILVAITGQAWLDPLAAMVFAVLMSVEAYNIARSALSEIMDEALDDDELEQVNEVLERWSDRIDGHHGLRTRKAGPTRFVEVHVNLDSDLTLGQAHDLVQQLAAEVRDHLPAGSRVLVHPDAVGRVDHVDEPLESM